MNAPEIKVVSKNGTIHVIEHTYTNQQGSETIVGLCNRMVGTSLERVADAAVTCKLCAKRAQ